MLKIRLSRVGKRNSPVFRLVVAEKSRAVKRENIEILGLYNPLLEKDKFRANKERVLFWIGKGAQPSDTANNLLCDFGVLPKSKKVKIVYGKKTKKKAKKDVKEVKTAEIAENKEAEKDTEENKIEEDKEDIKTEATQTTASESNG